MGAQYSVTAGAVTLTAAATKSLVLLNPVSNQFVLTQISISLNGSAAGTAVEFDLYRVVTIGSAAGTTGTENALNPLTQAATTTSLTSLTTEPTTVLVLDSWYIQELGGLMVLQYPLGREPLAATAGARYGIRYVTPAATTPSSLCTMWFEE
jgi:hypothetical protein